MGTSSFNIDKSNTQLQEIIKTSATVSKRLEQSVKNIALHLKEQTYDLINQDLQVFQFKNLKEIKQSYFSLQNFTIAATDKDKNIKMKLEQKQAEVYEREIKFMLHLIFLLRCSYKELKVNEYSYHHYGFVLLSFLLKKIHKNTFLQKLLAKILCSPMQSNIFSQNIIQAQDGIVLEHIFPLIQEDIIATTLNQILDITILQSEALQLTLLTLYYKNLTKQDRYKVKHYIFEQLNTKILKLQHSQIQYFGNIQTSNFFIQSNYTLNFNEKQRHRKFISILKGLTKQNKPISQHIFNNIFMNTKITDFLGHTTYQEISSTQINDYLLELQTQYFFLMQKILVLLNKTTLKKIANQLISIIPNRTKINFYFIFQRCFTLTIFILFEYKLPTYNELYINFPNLFPHHLHLLELSIQLRDIYHKEYINKVINKQSTSEQPYLTIISTDHLYVQLLIRCMKQGEMQTFLEKFNIEQLGFVKEFQDKMIEEDDGEGERQVKRVLVKNILHKISNLFNTFTNALINMSVLLLNYHLQNQYLFSQKILSNLLTVFDGVQAIFFKKIAQKFIKSQDVIKFIKEKAVIQNKKIHNKQIIIYELNLPIFSDFSNQQIQNQVFQRIIHLNLKNAIKQQPPKIYTPTNLNHYLKLFKKIIDYFDNFPQDQLKLQPSILSILQTLVNLIILTNNLELVSIAKRLEKRLVNIPSKLKLCLKKIQEKFNQNNVQVQKKIENQQKKKSKMNLLKQKQKLMLESYKIQQENPTKAQCIVCKNTKQGYPYLLGHFRYNNFFQNGVLIVGDRPFLQFSTCGHYIHQQCLQQSHKNQFRIWYPCILCKSICNVLLPSNQDNQEQAQIQRSICFLKNLAGIYFFYYKDRQNLLQFNLQTFTKIFPLLFKSLTYLITVYPLLNVQYFQRSQYPIARFIYKILVLTQKKVMKIDMFSQDVIKGQPLFCQLYSYISRKLKSSICQTEVLIVEEFNQFISKETFLFVDEIIEALSQNIDEVSFKNITGIDKIYREIAVSKIIKPQADLYVLQNLSRNCKSCNSKNIAQQICLLCGWNCCRLCLDVRKVHSKQTHLGQAIFLRTDNGKYVYIHDDLTGQFQSLYIDFLGEQLKQDKKVNLNEYRLNNQSWQTVINDLLANRIHREIMKFN